MNRESFRALEQPIPPLDDLDIIRIDGFVSPLTATRLKDAGVITLSDVMERRAEIYGICMHEKRAYDEVKGVMAVFGYTLDQEDTLEES